MRVAPILAGLAALAFTQIASAQNVTLEPVSFSPEFQTTLEEDIGVREGAYLRGMVTRAVDEALSRRGVSAGGRIELSIIDAAPNRPTMQQLVDRPGLDAIRSVSTGGAELHATIRGANGQMLGEVSHRYFSVSLQDVWGVPSTWSDARRSIRRFAEKVADAYVAHASAQ